MRAATTGRPHPAFVREQHVLPFNGADPSKVYAPKVYRQTATFPSRRAAYWDLAAWGRSFVLVTNLPGLLTIRKSDGTRLNLKTGEITVDPRYKEAS